MRRRCVGRGRAPFPSDKSRLGGTAFGAAAAEKRAQERWRGRSRGRFRRGHCCRFLHRRLALGDRLLRDLRRLLCNFLRGLLRRRFHRFLLLARRSGLLGRFLLRLRLLCHDRPPDPYCVQYPVGPQWEAGFTPQITDRAPVQPAVTDGRMTERGRYSRSAGGQGPPVAQSINSTVWTTGSLVPAAICVMQPILPAAIKSGRNLSIVPTLRSRNRLEISGCRILYVPAEPQHKWPSGTSFTAKPSLSSSSFGCRVIRCPCCRAHAA